MLCLKSVMFISKMYDWFYCRLKFEGFISFKSDYIFIVYISTDFTVIFLYDYGENIWDEMPKKCTE
jgi:hypothetical protein